MFPASDLKAQDLFEMNERDRLQIMNAQAKYATDFIVSGNYAVDETGVAVIIEFVFQRTYVRLSKRHVNVVLRKFPYAAMKLGKYGVEHEDGRALFIECLSILLTGVSFADVHEFKDLMEKQHRRIFDPLDRQFDRMNLG